MAKDEQVFKEVRFEDGTYLSDPEEIEEYLSSLPQGRSLTEVIDLLSSIIISVESLRQIMKPQIATLISSTKKGSEHDVPIFYQPDILFELGDSKFGWHSYWFQLDAEEQRPVIVQVNMGDAVAAFNEQDPYYSLCHARLSLNSNSAGRRALAEEKFVMEFEKLKAEIVRRLQRLVRL